MQRGGKASGFVGDWAKPLPICGVQLPGGSRVYVTDCKNNLIRPSKQRFDCVGTLDWFDDVADTDRDVWSHPALIGNRLYIRNLLAVYCCLIE